MTSIPPSPVEIVLVAANDQTPASPQVPARRPFHVAPCACAQSSIRKMPSALQYSAICSISNAMWPPMWTTKAARGLNLSAFATKSANETQRSSRFASTNSTRAPAATAASGVAMNVLDGQRTTSPLTSANSSAASAPPDQLPNATAGKPFEAAQADSNDSVSVPSDQRSDSIAMSHRAWRRGRSRRSKPIANWSIAGCREE